jgi:hypothetical protein
VVDDQDFALTPAIFQGAAGALALVQSPATHALQHGGAVDSLSEALQFGSAFVSFTF